MRIELEFAALFRSLGFENCTLEVPESCGLEEAMSIYIDKEPRRREILNERNLFLKGKLRAIYIIDGKAVKGMEVLKNGDTVKVLQAFIGG